MAILLACSLSACSKPAPKRATAVPETTGVPTIRVALPPTGPVSVVNDLLISEFQAAHPEYRVEKVDLDNPITKDFLAKDPAVDAIFLNLGGDDAISSPALNDLSPYVSKSRLDLNQYAVGAADIQAKGRLYGLPYVAAPRVLVANVKLFEAAGVPLPKDGWTWSDFRDTAARLTKPDHSVYGLTQGSLEVMAHLYLIQASGGKPARQAGGGAMKDALTLFSGITLTDGSTSRLPRLINGPLQQGRSTAEFPDGKAAMSLSPLYPGLKDAYSFPVAILPLPTIAGSKATILSWYYSLGLPLSAPNPEGGWEFIKFASGPEGAVVLAKSGILPVYTDQAVQDAWLQSGALGGEYVVKTHWSGFFGSWSQTQEELMNLMDNTINSVLSGMNELEPALAAYNERFKVVSAKQ